MSIALASKVVGYISTKIICLLQMHCISTFFSVLYLARIPIMDSVRGSRMKVGKSKMSRQRYCRRGLPGGTDGKESACNAGDLDSIPGLGRSPGEGKGDPLRYTCLENPHGQRSLVGYSLWG